MNGCRSLLAAHTLSGAGLILIGGIFGPDNTRLSKTPRRCRLCDPLHAVCMDPGDACAAGRRQKEGKRIAARTRRRRFWLVRRRGAVGGGCTYPGEGGVPPPVRTPKSPATGSAVATP